MHLYSAHVISLYSQFSIGLSCCDSCAALVDAVFSYPYLDKSSASAVKMFLDDVCDDNDPDYNKVCTSPYSKEAMSAMISQYLDPSLVCFLMNFCPDTCYCCE